MVHVNKYEKISGITFISIAIIIVIINFYAINNLKY